MRASPTSATATSPRAVRGATWASQRASPPSRTGRPRPSVTDTRKPLLSGSTAVGVVGLHDLLHELVPHDVLFIEPNERNPLDVADHLHRLDEAGRAAGRKIDLRDVAGDNRLRPEAETRQEHLHLFG